MNKVILEIEASNTEVLYIVRANGKSLATAKTELLAKHYLAMLIALCQVAGILYEVKK